MRRILSVLVVCGAATACRAADEAEALARQVAGVAERGQGQEAAVRAAAALSASGPDALLPILKAMNDCNPLARNWLRGAFEAIASRAIETPGQFPADALRAFFDDRANEPRARRLAFEWLAKSDAEAAARIIARSLDDPSSEMRRDAVVVQMQTAAELLEQGDRDAARTAYLAALEGAGDEDQVQELAKVLKDLGHEVNFVQHAGFLMQWTLLGPFDNKNQGGFDVPYPPEQEVALDKEYSYEHDGQSGKTRWMPYTSTKSDGLFDIAGLVAPYKGAIMYATTTFESEATRDVEFRLATPNAWKLWLNGELLFAREEYHRGMFFDQYQVRGRLKPGENRLLLKVCQNEQEDAWAQDWSFQFRVCDLTGRAIPPAPRRTAAAESEASTNP
ncbi:MAG: hypothetical protein KF774_18490 [Planctomyces sp.]|nr:hypothetical protein [Planctomyces sp.]